MQKHVDKNFIYDVIFVILRVKMSVITNQTSYQDKKQLLITVEIESTQQSIHVDFWTNLYKYY